MKKTISVILAVIMSMMCIVPVFAAETETAITTLDKMVEVSEFIKQAGYSFAVVTDMNGEELDANEYVPNGAYIVEMNNGVAEQKTQICLMEDVNCDGKITAADARLALRCAAKLEKLEGLRFTAADVNKDEKITAADARLIIRKPAKLS